MGGAISVIWVIIMVVFAIASGKAKGGALGAAQKNVEDKAKEIAQEIKVDPSPAFAKVAKAKKVFASPTKEKTHDHNGELADTILLEDRKNDWLANQIKEEARLRKHPLY